jgi:hypothetical protein
MALLLAITPEISGRQLQELAATRLPHAVRQAVSDGCSLSAHTLRGMVAVLLCLQVCVAV